VEGIMKRDIENTLKEWKNEKRRYPLLVRGARQVGKSYSMRKFGQENFENLVEINFEQNPEYKICFETFDPLKIVESISLLLNVEISPGKTLLFLDEIQECPKAIISLRYFYEQFSDLHVIGAGSLLEFTLSQEDFRMPVGRIQYIFLKPLSFLEFLDALEETKIREKIENLNKNNMPEKFIHDHILSFVKLYSIIGGMPAVVNEYIHSKDIKRCLKIQTLIIQTYRDDFGKYASKIKYKYLQKIFYAVPKMVGKKFKYSNIDREMQTRDLKEALNLLEKAGVVFKIKHTSGKGLPLEFNSRENIFKTAFLDIGLMQNLCGLNIEIFMSSNEDFIKINNGAIAEQFVAQELIAYQDCNNQPNLYYWVREAKSSNAEIDFIIPCCSKALPIEVKSGKTGTLRSMHQFLKNADTSFGIKISQLPFDDTPPITSIPFYAIKRISSLVCNMV
jgi:predicted AAA+ superfamily ATPase